MTITVYSCTIYRSTAPGSLFHQRPKRWAVSAYDREDLPARAFCAADAEKRKARPARLSLVRSGMDRRQ